MIAVGIAKTMNGTRQPNAAAIGPAIERPDQRAEGERGALERERVVARLERVVVGEAASCASGALAPSPSCEPARAMNSIQVVVASPVSSENAPQSDRTADRDRDPLDAVGGEPDRHRQQDRGARGQRDEHERGSGAEVQVLGDVRQQHRERALVELVDEREAEQHQQRVQRRAAAERVPPPAEAADAVRPSVGRGGGRGRGHGSVRLRGRRRRGTSRAVLVPFRLGAVVGVGERCRLRLGLGARARRAAGSGPRGRAGPRPSGGTRRGRARPCRRGRPGRSTGSAGRRRRWRRAASCR